MVRGGLVRIVEVAADQRVRLCGHDAAGLFSVYPVTDGNAGSTWQGRRLTPGQLVVRGAEVETDHYTARRTENRGASIRSEALGEAARALLGTDAAALPQTWAA